MLDRKFVLQNIDKVKSATKSKNEDPKLVDAFVKLDFLYKKLDAEYQKKHEILSESQKKTEKILLEKGVDNEDVKKQISQSKKFKEEEKGVWNKLQEADLTRRKALFEIPNIPAEDVKIGKDESENEEVKKWGDPKDFKFKVRDHLEIGQLLDIVDTERASKVSGSRFGYLKGDGALLELALVNFAFSTLIKEGFIPVIPPTLIRRESMEGMGYLEHGGEEDMYVLDKDGLILVGTAEQSLGPMHMGEVLEVEKLPLRYAGFSSCFRREAGSYGKDTRGIMRVHQFDKVEMFSITKPSESDREHDFLLSLEEKFFQALKIPYHILKMCTGDLGHPAARKYDIEAWFPSEKRYREVTSASTTTDYQSRRLRVKYKEGGTVNFVHMLNGTAFAIGRTLIAILENYQQEDGSVLIPDVLKPYLGKDKMEKS